MFDERNERLSVDDNRAVVAQVEHFLVAWFTLRRQIQALNFNRAHQNGLSLTQFTALVMLSEAHDPATTIGWLAQRLTLDAATVVRTVDSLGKARSCHVAAATQLIADKSLSN